MLKSTKGMKMYLFMYTCSCTSESEWCVHTEWIKAGFYKLIRDERQTSKIMLVASVLDKENG